MHVLGNIFGAIFDGFLAAFGWMSLSASLFLISMLLGLLMLYAFKWVGNPQALERSQARMQAHLMEMRLFDREPRIVMRSLGQLLWWNLRFFVASLRPAVFATLPMVLLFVQMEHYYGARPLRPGETAVVTAYVNGRALEGAADWADENGEPVTSVEVEGPIEVAAPPVRVRDPREPGFVSFTIRALEEGEGYVTLKVGERGSRKSVHVSETPRRVSMRRVRHERDTLLYPVERRIARGPIGWIEVDYPKRDISMFGLETHWLLWLVLVSVFGAFLLKWTVELFLPGALSPGGAGTRPTPPRVWRYVREAIFLGIAGVTVWLLWIMLDIDPRLEGPRMRGAPVTVLASDEGADAADAADTDTGGFDESGETPVELDDDGPRPDIILITIDTLRADRIGAYGYTPARTPVIDTIAREGLRFEHSTTAFPRTTPAMASLFTGLWPHHHGSREVWQTVRQGTFLTELLKERGYKTLGVTANSACGSRQHFDRGFDELINRDELSGKKHDAKVVTDMALKLLKQVKQPQPLFLWVHYVDPHWPYGPPKKEVRNQPEAPACRDLIERAKQDELEKGEFLDNHDGMAARALADCSQLYDASIAFNDHELGRLIKRLKRMGRWDDALVVLTSDHGENLGEDGYYFDHGPSLNDASLRVPLLLRGPGVPIGEVDYGVARSEDIVPTVLEMLRVPKHEWPEVDGYDLSWRWDEGAPMPPQAQEYALAESGSALSVEIGSFVASGRKGKRYCVHGPEYTMCVERRPGEAPLKTYYLRASDKKFTNPIEPVEIAPATRRELDLALHRWPSGTARRRMVRTRRYKLVEIPRFEGGYRQELYDLEADPGETTNVLEDNKRVARRLSRVLKRWLDDLPVYEEQTRSDEEVRELKALGYIGD